MFLLILESEGQEETVDTHIAHFWWPQIFDLHYCDVAILTGSRLALLDLSDLKFGMEPSMGNIQPWLYLQVIPAKFTK